MWKFYKTGACQKGAECPYSHNLKLHPCKFLHSTGVCKYGSNCEFSHERLDDSQIYNYIEENEDFLDHVYKENGITLY